MPWERWYYDQRPSLARYVHPEARKWLREPLGVNWYDENRDADGRRRLVRALYEALRGHGINYTPEKYDPEKRPGQAVRTLNEVLQGPQPEGTCLDLALAFCGLCLSFELIPWVVVVKGHAFAVVCLTHGRRDWRASNRHERRLFLNGPLTTATDLIATVSGEVATYLAVECTGFASSRKGLAPSLPEGAGRDPDGLLDFPAALAAGAAQLHHPGREFQFAIDLAVALAPKTDEGWGYEPHPQPDPPSESSADRSVSAWLLPALVDREPQTLTIHTTLRVGLAAPACPPAIFLIEGDEDQAHRRLMRRLACVDLPRSLRLRLNDWRAASCQFDLPSAKVTDFDLSLRTNLDLEFPGPLPDGAPVPGWDRLAERLRNHPQPVLFWTTYTTEDWEQDRGARAGRPTRLAELIDAWGRCGELPPARAPIVCVNVIYKKHKVGWLERLGWRRPRAQLDQHLAELVERGYDLQLMSWGDGSGVSTSDRCLVIAGTDAAGLLRIRTFDTVGVRTDTYEKMEGNALHLVSADASGKLLADAPESRLSAARARAIVALKQRLPGLLAQDVLRDSEKAQVLIETTLITDRDQPGKRFAPGPRQPVRLVRVESLAGIDKDDLDKWQSKLPEWEKQGLISLDGRMINVSNQIAELFTPPVIELTMDEVVNRLDKWLEPYFSGA